jgi:hypothetical protein
MVVAALTLTFEFTVIPGEAKAVLAVAADLGVAQPESKYNVTVDGSDVVPNTVGMSDVPGVAGLMEEYESVGAVLSNVTILSDDVDAAFKLPNVSVTVFAAIDGMTVPAFVTVLARRFHVMLSVVVRVHVKPEAVLPVVKMSAVVNVAGSTAAEKTTVKSIGVELTGSP